MDTRTAPAGARSPPPERRARNRKPGRKQEGTGETEEATNDGSTRPNRGVNSNWGAADGLDIWEGYSDVEPARSSGDDSRVETSGAGRFGGGDGGDRVDDGGSDRSVEDASPDWNLIAGPARPRWIPHRQRNAANVRSRSVVRTHSRKRRHRHKK
jgi:hypothetical protein